ACTHASAKMSAILSADDLSDFITPSVACIKPVETLPVNSAANVRPSKLESESSLIILQNELEISFNSEQQPAKTPPAEISLTDCLACSGCVTSAEAVLVSMQSHAEVLSELDSAPALRLRANAACSSFGIENLDSGGRIYVASV